MNVLQELTTMVKSSLQIDDMEITKNTSIQDELNLDSITMLALLVKLEEKFDIELEEEYLLKIKTVGDLIELIENSIGLKI